MLINLLRSPLHIKFLPWLCLVLAIGVCCPARAQSTDYPLIGAQVFIEPGQSVGQIERWFEILEEQDMRVCRIRLFESHMHDENGEWDFSLYDAAFDAAAKHGVRIFATLFPANASGDVGGFKYPDSEAHLAQIGKYIDVVAGRYKDHPALLGWVLINEVGRRKLNMNLPYTRSRYESWLEAGLKTSGDTGYEELPHLEDEFQRWINNEYLGWLADRVRRSDPDTALHVNTHGLHHMLAQYDFPEWGNFLDSNGVSLHPSWHFGDFERHQYAMAVASANDIIRAADRSLPFWVTELQGGNNTASSVFPLCPTKEEIAQWLWTSIAAGAEGVIFWTLNPRAVGFEAGEWGMLDYTNQPTDRLLMAGRVARAVTENRELFLNATPVESGIHLLYNKESYFEEKRRFVFPSDEPARNPHAMILSLMSWYEALASQGASPQIGDLDNFHLEGADAAGQVAILPNACAVSAAQWDQLARFVGAGGKLIVTGLSGYYNETGQSAFLLGKYPANLLGARLAEFKVNQRHVVTFNDSGISLPAQMWRGYLHADTAESIAEDADGGVLATRNRFGLGEAVWIPSPLGLASWKQENTALSVWIREECGSQFANSPVSFNKPVRNTILRILDCGEQYLAVFVNTNDHEAEVQLQAEIRNARILFQSGGRSRISSNSVVLGKESTLVVAWMK